MPSITVPRLDWTMDEGKFVRWLKADGDAVQSGEPLFELESDKATEAIEAIDSGYLHIPADGPKPGDTVKVGQVVGLLLRERNAPMPESSLLPSPPLRGRGVGAEGVLGGAGFLTCHPEEGRLGNLHHIQRGGEGGTRTGKRGTRPAITPRARRAARELGIDWGGMRGSGRGGRIRERDVRMGVVGVGSEGRIIAPSTTRQVIAARMVAGVTKAAPVSLTTKADVTDLVAHRATLGKDAPGYTAYLVRAVALALKDHPMLRAQWRDEGLFIPARIHIAFGVDTEAGLLAPVVRDADRLGVDEIARACRALTIQARAGTIRGENMRGAVFTLSNLGMFGVESFTPIIHLPQCAVLGIGAIVREPALVEDRLVAFDRMTLCLTFDHRVTDGAPAARFLGAVRHLVERPDLLDG